VVIPTHNKVERLVLALHSYIRQTCGFEQFEVIVVADGCTDNTADRVRELMNILPLHLLETDFRGQSASRNEGAKVARGRYLIFVDDDQLLCPTYLEECLQSFKEGKRVVVRGTVYMLYYLRVFKDPEAGVPYPRWSKKIGRRSPLHCARISKDMVMNSWDLIARQCYRRNRFERLVQRYVCNSSFSRQIPWMGYSGTACGVDRSLFLYIGGYDESFGLLWGAESLELGYRLWLRGTEFHHLPKAYSAHMDHPREESLKTYHESFDYFFKKYGDPNIKFIEQLIMSKENIEFNKQWFR
jgi:glycosyltransferase involved in cell wall biosynthesis